jgi:hypothetical protein
VWFTLNFFTFCNSFKEPKGPQLQKVIDLKPFNPANSNCQERDTLRRIPLNVDLLSFEKGIGPGYTHALGRHIINEICSKFLETGNIR